MLKTLPFGALRTLEAVVRLRGFSRAAEELNVTQSAVSQHVKQLEEWLGTPLLVRRGRDVTPTEAGEHLAEATRDSFGTLAEVCDTVRSAGRKKPKGVLVASPPGFAFLWLLPRLLKFAELYPDTPVNLSTDPHSRGVLATEADVVIDYSAGHAPGVHVEHLMAEDLSPVCAPELAARVTSVEDLAARVILLDRLDDGSTLSHWELWARAAGVSLPAFIQTRTFGQANLVIQAAIDGLGIAMGRSPLVQDAIDAGKLVRPFEAHVDAPFGYWLLCRHDALHQDPVTRFVDWVRAEV